MWTIQVNCTAHVNTKFCKAALQNSRPKHESAWDPLTLNYVFSRTKHYICSQTNGFFRGAFCYEWGANALFFKGDELASSLSGTSPP